MKKITINLVAISLLCLSLVGIASAKGKELKTTFTFEQDTMVNDTLVKKGTYNVKFDTNSDELTITNGRQVVATAKATVETRAKKSEQTEVILHTTDNGVMLEGVIFQGDARNIMITMPNSNGAGA